MSRDENGQEVFLGSVGKCMPVVLVQGRTAHVSRCFDGLLTAAKVLALSCIRTMDRPDVIEAAKKELHKRNGGHYTCPLPDSVEPPLDTY